MKIQGVNLPEAIQQPRHTAKRGDFDPVNTEGEGVRNPKATEIMDRELTKKDAKRAKDLPPREDGQRTMKDISEIAEKNPLLAQILLNIEIAKSGGTPDPAMAQMMQQGPGQGGAGQQEGGNPIAGIAGAVGSVAGMFCPPLGAAIGGIGKVLGGIF